MKRNVYRLPMAGRWLVYWGGRRESENALHSKVSVQRYAFDFLKVGDDKKYFTGDGKKLSDYYSYDEIVYAPSDGNVVVVVDGIEDSLIPNLYFIPGNLVVIKHKGDEYSYIAHLQKGSVMVKEGDYVKSEQPLARCGGSGNSTMPHIHYHVSDNARFQDGNGIAIEFRNIQINEKVKRNGIPIKGDVVVNK